MTASNAVTAMKADDEVDFIDLWRTLWLRKGLVLAFTTLGVAIALVIAFVREPTFLAETVVTEVHDASMGGASSLANQFGGLAALAGVNIGANSDASREAQAVLASRHLIEEFVRRNDLIATLFPKAGSKPPTLWRAVKRFQNDVLTIRQDTRAGLTTVSVRWTNAATAAKWANQLVALTNEIMRTRALNEATRNVTYLRDQISKTNVVELQRVMYNLIETETKTLMLANARPEYAFRVVDAAVAPEQRFSPRRTVLVILGFVLGLVVGIAAALVRDVYVRIQAVRPMRQV